MKSSPVDPKKEIPRRLGALDALRGFVMFWIIGGDTLAYQLAKACDWRIFAMIDTQMRHVAWNGFRFYDAIFPTFLFAAGVAIPFSSQRRLEEGKTTRFRELLTGAERALILILLGLVINGILKGDWGRHMENVRFGSVLGRIGIAWFLALAISLFCGWRGWVLWLMGLLFGYWAMMTLIPVPEYGAGVLERGKNLCDYIDQLLMPGRLHGGNHDPEGLLSTIPAIGTALIGVLAGDFMRHNAKDDNFKASMLTLAGSVAIGIALIWNLAFPINKHLWTSSFVLMAGGISLILFAFFHWLMAARNWNAPAFFFTVIGMNAIAIYIAVHGLIDFGSTAEFLFAGAINGIGITKAWCQVLMTIGTLSIEWLCLWFLWRQKLFVRV
jgi:predicted acyltransferase